MKDIEIEDELINEVEVWLDENVYHDDEGARRKIFFDEYSEKYYFPADPLDFDKDDIRHTKHFLEGFEGYKTEYEPVIEQYFLG